MTVSDDARRLHLRECLDRHEPGDEIERSHRARMLSLLHEHRDAFRRDHWSPGHFTSSAFVLSPDRDCLLLVLHGKLHRWLQPGGHVEPSDPTVLASALREVAEETGLKPLPFQNGLLDVDVHAIPARGEDPEHEHFDVRFLFIARDDVFHVGSDAHDARWVPLDAVSTIETDASVMRAVEKIRRIFR